MIYAQQIVHKDGPCPQMPLVAPVDCTGTHEEAKAFLLDRLLSVAPAMAPSWTATPRGTRWC